MLSSSSANWCEDEIERKSPANWEEIEKASVKLHVCCPMNKQARRSCQHFRLPP